MTATAFGARAFGCTTFRARPSAHLARPPLVGNRRADGVDAAVRALTKTLRLRDDAGRTDRCERRTQQALLHDAMVRRRLLQLRETGLEAQHFPAANLVAAIGEMVHIVKAVEDVASRVRNFFDARLVRKL